MISIFSLPFDIDVNAACALSFDLLCHSFEAASNRAADSPIPLLEPVMMTVLLDERNLSNNAQHEIAKHKFGLNIWMYCTVQLSSVTVR